MTGFKTTGFKSSMLSSSRLWLLYKKTQIFKLGKNLVFYELNVLKDPKLV